MVPAQQSGVYWLSAAMHDTLVAVFALGDPLTLAPQQPSLQLPDGPGSVCARQFDH